MAYFYINDNVMVFYLLAASCLCYTAVLSCLIWSCFGLFYVMQVNLGLIC
ncbi:hypothetical protein Hdeb2414_s0007g00238661 [Helianthus debilis subsp. tardiflorus]